MNKNYPSLVYFGMIRGGFALLKQEANVNSESSQQAIATLSKQLPLMSHFVGGLTDEQHAVSMAISVSLHNLTNGIVATILKDTEAIYDVFLKRRIHDVRKDWHTYVKREMAKGGGKLFQYISKWEKFFLSVQWESTPDSDTTFKTVDEFLDFQLDKWENIWAPQEDAHSQSNLVADLNMFREAALDEDVHVSFDAHALKQSLKVYRKDTLGCDNFKASELRVFPECALQGVASSLEQAINTIAMPHQFLLSLNALLGKPSGDSRTVCKTPMLYRMLLRNDQLVRQWEMSNRAPFDSATTGASALLAALKRNLLSEIAHWSGMRSGAMFNDYNKFFDTINISKLLEEAVYCKFPFKQMSFALQQHLAPRMLQTNGYSSRVASIFKSILAGCKFSVAFTKSLTQRLLTQIHEEQPKANLGVHVDDTSMMSFGIHNDDVVDPLINSMDIFQKMVRKLDLKLSPKAAVTASNPTIVNLLSSELGKMGLVFKTPSCARDLGIDYNSGKMRQSRSFLKRFRKASNKFTKIKSLASISRGSRNLFTGSAFSSSTWGHQASALSDSHIIASTLR